MSTTIATDETRPGSLADLLASLGGIDPARVRLRPAPGTATEADLATLGDAGKLLELIDGAFVEKAMGFREARLAAVLISFLEVFLRANRLGLTTGPDGTVRLAPGLVRIPDVAFFTWDHFPGRRVPKTTSRTSFPTSRSKSRARGIPRRRPRENASTSSRRARTSSGSSNPTRGSSASIALRPPSRS